MGSFKVGRPLCKNALLLSCCLFGFLVLMGGGAVAAGQKVAAVSNLGVNWGVLNTHSVPPEIAVQMLKDNGIGKVKLFIADEPILTALAGSGIEVMVAIPNGDLEIVTDYAKAKDWVKNSVLRYNATSPSGVNIKYVAIGNEPFLMAYNGSYTNQTYPALSNVQKALNDAGVGDKIKATVPLNADIYNSPSYNPVPSAGRFRPDIKDQMLQILEVLDKNNAPFVINIYPFLNLYLNRDRNFPRDYAFFDGIDSPLVDKTTNFSYNNSFEAAYDGLLSALAAEGYANMTVMIGEVGWPTDGDVDANLQLAARFYNGLLPRLTSKKGTPLRPGKEIPVYLFELFDEDAKSIDPGTFERHWGLFTYDGQPKLPNLSLHPGARGLVPARNVTYLPKKWCQLKPKAAKTDPKIISEKVEYACSRADCTKLVDGGSCNGLDANAKISYAFNAYFQAMNQTKDSCDFQGLAEVTMKNTSEPNCNFTIQLAPLKDAADDTPEKHPEAKPPRSSAPASAPAPNSKEAPPSHSKNAPAPNSQNSPPASSSAPTSIHSFSWTALLFLVAQLPLLLVKYS